MATKITKNIQWNLDDIFRLEDFESLYQEIEKGLEELVKMMERLDPEMEQEEFGKILEFDEKLGVKMSRLVYRPSLAESVDQKDQEAKRLKSKAENLGLLYSQKVRRLSHWIKGLSEINGKRLDNKNAKRLFRVIPDLEYGLHYSRMAAKHNLSEKEEDIISHKDINGIEALKNLREMMETEFEYGVKIKGTKTKKIKTLAQLTTLFHSNKSEEREGAYRALLEKHKENIDKLFLVYQAVVKDWDYETKLRGFPTPIGARNFANQVPDKAIENLLTVCSEKSYIFHDYFQWKAQELGQKQLRRFDVYAPLVGVQKKYTFEAAQKLVFESLADFDEDFYQYGKKIVEENHIDVFPHPTKRGGAFCATVEPRTTPYVLLNHVGSLRDVFTMAHELGHGIHSLFASHHYPSVQHANLPLAETASTFGEMLLFDKLYSQEKDKSIKKKMLSEKVAEAFATILRQNYFVIFEMRAHEAISKGITAEELSRIYFQTLTEEFGESVEIDPLFRYEWAYISHIVETPFYCYAYNFGELLSYSLYSRYQNEGKEFIKEIKQILSKGGSEDPAKILQTTGIDMTAKEFWEEGFDLIKKWQEELKELSK